MTQQEILPRLIFDDEEGIDAVVHLREVIGMPTTREVATRQWPSMPYDDQERIVRQYRAAISDDPALQNLRTAFSNVLARYKQGQLR